MGRRITYVIAGELFPSQKALLARIRSVIDTTPLGQSIAPAEYEFVRALLDRHPDVDQKVGCGVVDLQVDQSPEYGSTCFFLVRGDGTRTEFSFKECIRPSMPLDKFKSAARNVIADQKMAYKLRFFEENPSARCPDTDEPLSLERSHVDHAGEYSFDRIVTDFIAEHGIDVEAVEFTGKAEDNVVLTEFADAALRESFAGYHRERATLEVVSARANLSGRRKGRC
jgi:hypothetical protein